MTKCKANVDDRIKSTSLRIKMFIFKNRQFIDFIKMSQILNMVKGLLYCADFFQNMTGDQSPHVDATVVFNGRLQPNRCTWMKFQVS